MSKILVIGGTYFTGRVFTIVAAREGHELTLVNRGRYSMARPGVTEYRADRNDAAAVAALPLADEHYDAVVDFCAYDVKGAKTVIENLPCRYDRYIVLTTADVCERTGGVRNEETPLLNTEGIGAVDQYLYHKTLLEKFVYTLPEKYGIDYTILRPAFIYGPYNYAPRENFYFEKIYKNQPLPMPTDAVGRFQMVYVKDVALAILACVAQPDRCRNAIYNLAAPDVLDYGKFFGVLTRITDRPFEVQPVTVQQVLDGRIAVPFPLYHEEDEVFDGTKIVRELGFEYTDLDANMKNTFAGLKPVYDPEG
ncbi:MAG: NAD-dependent epimerase/dehydratase family protein [Lachnospiraceae bacterium]|nr:NAD-dependent epimerase/dehydratase family protein [Lachnospiraceae bacterium]